MITEKYENLCNRSSDINEHLPILSMLASECDHVTELGVRGIVSSWAFVHGLPTNSTLFMNDINYCDINEIQSAAKVEKNIDVHFVEGDDLTIELPMKTDLTFIDTWHVYGQLKRELVRYAPITKKYIVMHDTTIDEERGETLRCNFNEEEQSAATGIPIEEITRGIWPAIEEFIETHKNEWKLHERYTNNNGLTILKRVKDI